MKCKMCGAELKKDGELCNNCMNKILKEEEIKKDKVKVYEFKRTFVLGYQLSQHVESLIIAVVMVAVLLVSSLNFLFESIVFLVIVLIGISLIFVYDKYKIKNSKCTFYQTKFIYKKIAFFRRIEVEIPYDEVKEIAYNQTRYEKLFKLGTIYIKTTSKNLLDKNIYIDCIKDVDVVFKTIKEKLGE